MKWKFVGPMVALALVLPCEVFAQGISLSCVDPCNIDPDVIATHKGLDPAGYSGVEIGLYNNNGNLKSTIGSDSGGIFNWRGQVDYFFQQKSSATNTKDFISFCLEVNQLVKTKPNAINKFNITPLADAPVQAPNKTTGGLIGAMGETAATAIAQLWGYKMPDLLPGISNHPNNDNVQIKVAAMQLAIWELATDQGTFNLYQGNLRVIEPSKPYAKTPEENRVVWLARKFYNQSQKYYEDNPEAPLPTLVALTNPCYQDQLVALVPEPTSMLAWVIFGCIGFIGTRRYRRR